MDVDRAEDEPELSMEPRSFEWGRTPGSARAALDIVQIRFELRATDWLPIEGAEDDVVGGRRLSEQFGDR
ncbi:MAG TPA: hypothetical protein VF230_12200, partial [Acidimicrobiales bacterium]